MTRIKGMDLIAKLCLPFKILLYTAYNLQTMEEDLLLHMNMGRWDIDSFFPLLKEMVYLFLVTWSSCWVAI